jgi:hypothetical protein
MAFSGPSFCPAAISTNRPERVVIQQRIGLTLQQIIYQPDRSYFQALSKFTRQSGRGGYLTRTPYLPEINR